MPLMSVQLDAQVPQAAELSALEEVLQAAIRIQRVWRKWRKNTTAEQRTARRLSSRRERCFMKGCCQMAAWDVACTAAV